MIRMLRIRRERSGSVARRRLKILLAADKTGCSPELLEMLKGDLCRVLSRYMEVDSDRMEVRVERMPLPGSAQDMPAPCANIPIRRLTCSKGTFG